MTRRLTAAAGIALTLLALAACRDSPNVAAYVGDQTFTEDYVTTLVDEVDGQLTREQVVQLLVFEAVCAQAAEKAGVNVPAPSASPEAGAPTLAAISARAQACDEALPAEPVEATDAELREIFDIGVAAGVIPPETTFEEAKAQLAGETLSAALGKRKTILAAIEDADVSVNPRYGELPLSLLSFQNPEQSVAVQAELGGQTEAVTDGPVETPAPTGGQVPAEAPAAN